MIDTLPLLNLHTVVVIDVGAALQHAVQDPWPLPLAWIKSCEWMQMQKMAWEMLVVSLECSLRRF